RRGARDIAGRVPVPQGLDALVRARVRALPAEARDALLRAATLARPDTETIDPVELAPAEEAGLVRVEVDGRIEFVHPLFASAVYSAAPAARLREAHRAVADLARDPEDRARHLALAASGPDAQVVRELQAAARHARMRGSPDSAAELTGLALRLLPANAPARRVLQLELAEQLHLASDFPAARALLEELRATFQPGDLRARALEERHPPATVDTRVVFKLGQWLRYIDDLDGARAALEQAEEQAREEGDESSLANILLNRVIVATWAGDLAGAAELAERMLDAFGQHGVGPEAGDIWRAYVDAYAGRGESDREAAGRADPGSRGRRRSGAVAWDW